MSVFVWQRITCTWYFSKQVFEVLKYFSLMFFFICFQMRHLFLVIDMSKSMDDQDLKPTRLISTLKVGKMFLWTVHKYFLWNVYSSYAIIQWNLSGRTPLERPPCLERPFSNFWNLYQPLDSMQTEPVWNDYFSGKTTFSWHVRWSFQTGFTVFVVWYLNSCFHTFMARMTVVMTQQHSQNQSCCLSGNQGFSQDWESASPHNFFEAQK